ncbi:hypothetical protein AJ87_15725 [Rhizobium yanglingense]|nr:hypothetical protein AJ87_15725 [Rhizobium yanglingense]
MDYFNGARSKLSPLPRRIRRQDFERPTVIHIFAHRILRMIHAENERYRAATWGRLALTTNPGNRSVKIRVRIVYRHNENAWHEVGSPQLDPGKADRQAGAGNDCERARWIGRKWGNLPRPKSTAPK